MNLKAALLAVLCLAVSGQAMAQNAPIRRPVIIGYLPAFKPGMQETLAATDLSRLTHINVAFLNPDKTGAFVRGDAFPCMDGPAGQTRTGADLANVVQTAHAANVKVLVSLGGGILPACSSDWNLVLSDPDKAVADLMAVVDAYGLDGLDVDLEWEVLSALDRAGLYTPFIAKLRTALTERGKLLTCATASNPGGMIPQASIPYFDHINLMSYDMVGASWGKPGEEHSPYAQALKDIETWEALGARPDQIVLGVPWYGYGFGAYKGGWSYRRILETFGPQAAETDLQGQACATPDGGWCDYITYNGRPTLKAKAELAKSRGAGVMIWELTDDVAGDLSLLRLMHDTLNAQPGD